MISFGPFTTVLVLVGWGLSVVVAPLAAMALVAAGVGALDALLGTRREMDAPGAASQEPAALAESSAVVLPAEGMEALAAAAKRQAELELVEQGLSDDDWLVVLDLLRNDVPKESIYRMMRLRHAYRRVSGERRSHYPTPRAA
jgi:hypothetical protein